MNETSDERRERRDARRAPSLLVSRLSPLVARLAWLLLASCTTPGSVERVAIPPGATVRAAADSLAAHGIIRSTTWFRVRTRLSGRRLTFKAGVYDISRGTSTAEILRRLRAGDAERFRITLPIGATLFDLARATAITLPIPPESLLAAARDSALLRALDIPGGSAEGWLEPESFDFGGFDAPRDVITRFADARRRDWDSTWDRRAAAAGLDREGLLVLASIVEAEAKDPSERPVIAAVYRNRLRLHMPLQADPTIQYAYLVRDGARKPRLYYKDYLLASPWNTYLHPGLPPGPIDNPSREAIGAVLDPAPEPYLYFVAGPDGRSLFARTLAEHLHNIARVRRGP